MNPFDFNQQGNARTTQNSFPFNFDTAMQQFIDQARSGQALPEMQVPTGAAGTGIPSLDVKANPLSGAQKLGMGIDIGSALLNGFLGFKQLGLAEDQLDFSKDSFNKNYAANKQQYNTQLAGRYASAQSADPNLTQSLSDYMNQNGIK